MMNTPSSSLLNSAFSGMSSATIKLHVAELMPVATTEKNGLMPISAFNIYNWINGIGTTQKETIIEVTMYSKFYVLCGCIGNYSKSRLFSISRIGTGDLKPLIESIYRANTLNFHYVYNDTDDQYVIYVSGLGSWGEFSIIQFAGYVLSMKAVSEVPVNAKQITVTE